MYATHEKYQTASPKDSEMFHSAMALCSYEVRLHGRSNINRIMAHAIDKYKRLRIPTAVVGLCLINQTRTANHHNTIRKNTAINISQRVAGNGCIRIIVVQPRRAK